MSNKRVDNSSFEETSSIKRTCLENEFVKEDTLTLEKRSLSIFSFSHLVRPTVRTNLHHLIFQQLDVNHYTGKINYNFKYEGNTRNRIIPIIRLFGVTKEGHSVMCHVHGFFPYLYILAPSSNFSAEMLLSFKYNLNKAILKEYIDSKRPDDHYISYVTDAVLNIEPMYMENIYGYRGNLKQLFLKITFLFPEFVHLAKNILEAGKIVLFSWLGMQAFTTFESNIDFNIRFMIDSHITSCSWIEIPFYKYRIRAIAKDSYCQLEVDAHYKDLISHSPEGEWAIISPFRILSFDIECAGRKGIFPEPEIDPVIQIANVLQIQNANREESLVKLIFTLNTCDPIPGSTVISFQNEADMLVSWVNFLHAIDPDVLTGYNIQNFDIPYLISRAKRLDVEAFPYLGKIKSCKTQVKDFIMQSKQMGRKQNKKINIEGRILFDVLQIVLRDYKLRSYTLNAVSFHFLQEQKEDVHHTMITDLQNNNSETRKRLAVYCLKDALLPIRLLDKLMSLINYMEMSRVTGVPLNYLLSRGQQVKVMTQILKISKEQGLVIPAMQVEQGENYAGATVIEPIKGYYSIPIVTLDFASLYPSIMMAYNLCYTTVLPDGFINSMNIIHHHNPDDDSQFYIKTPSSNYFVKPEIRKGLLPEILENLLLARKKAKDDLKKETDPFLKKVLDGRQLALKISANSVYGLTGSQTGKLPCLEISQSVTAFGRTMIEKTKELVEAKFTIANGYKTQAVVIYGDTDSVMINFGVTNLKEAIELGKEAAAHVSSHFIQPIKLEFEKVYYPYLLINKKRYAGLYYTNAERYDKMDCKGIETVRRDNCLLVAKVMQTCLEKILIEKNPQSAVQYVKQIISDLLCNRIDISQLVITKELTKSSREYASKQAHIELAKKMRKRDAGSAPNLGDRVPYVIVKSTKGTPAYLKAEDPLYVLDNDIPIDTEYYLHNQLSKPLLRIFELILGEKAESILFRGEHTLTRSIATPKTGILSQFIKKLHICIGCKSVLPSSYDSKEALCHSCKSKENEIYHDETQKFNELSSKFTELWNQCQVCQGDSYQKIICTNNDCPIFYMRTKAGKDLDKQKETMKRFQW